MDREIRFKVALSNPELLKQIEAASQVRRDINFAIRLANPEVLKEISNINTNRSITLNISAGNALTQLGKLEQEFKKIQELSTLTIKTGSSPEQTLRNIQIEKLKQFSDEQKKLYDIPKNLASVSASEIDKLSQATDKRIKAEETIKALQSDYYKNAFVAEEKLAAIKQKNMEAFLAQQFKAEEQKLIRAKEFENQVLREQFKSEESKQQRVKEFQSKFYRDKFKEEEASLKADQQRAKKAAAGLSPEVEQAIRARESQVARDALRKSNLQERVNIREAQSAFDAERIPRISARITDYLGITKGKTKEIEEEILEKQAKSKGLPEGSLSRTPLKGLDFNLLKNEKAFTELGFAVLSKGPLAAAGGAVGGAALGAGGVFLGSAVAEAAGELFGKITESLNEAIQAGIEFENSITAIAAVLQTNTKITGPNGENLPLAQQIKGQERRAEAIQLAAREKLLPLGIGGEQEATLVSAVQTAAGQKGIVLTAEQTATIAQRLGAATSVINPAILSNSSQLRRDIEDILLGLPQAQRTALGAATRRQTAKLGSARTSEELVSATEGLKPFVDELTQSDKFVVQQRRINGAFSSIMTNIGSSITTLAAGPMKLFAGAAEAVAAATATATEGFKFMLRGFTNEVVNVELNPEAKIQSSLSKAGITQDEFEKQVEESKAFGAGERLSALREARETAKESGILNEDPVRAAAFTDSVIKELQASAESRKNVLSSVGGITGTRAALNIDKELNKDRKTELVEGVEDIGLKLNIRDLTSGEVATLKAQLNRQLKELATSIGRSLDIISQEIGQGLTELDQKLSSVGNLGLKSKISKVDLQIVELPNIAKQAESSLSQALQDIAEGIEAGLSPEQIGVLRKRANELQLEIKQINNKLAEAYQEAFNLSIDKLTQNVSDKTIGGRAKLVTAGAVREFGRLTGEEGLDNKTASILAAGNFARGAIGEIAGNSQAGLSFIQSRESFQDFLRDLPNKFGELADAVDSANLSLEKFKEDQDSRTLDRKQSVLSAADRARKAGISEIDIDKALSDAGISLTDRDTESFFGVEKQSALANLNKASRDARRGSTEDRLALRGLERSKQRAEFQEENFPREIRNQNLNNAINTLQGFQQFAGTPLGEALKGEAAQSIANLQSSNQQLGIASPFDALNPEDLVSSVSEQAKLDSDNISKFNTGLTDAVNALQNFTKALGGKVSSTESPAIVTTEKDNRQGIAAAIFAGLGTTGSKATDAFPTIDKKAFDKGMAFFDEGDEGPVAPKNIKLPKGLPKEGPDIFDKEFLPFEAKVPTPKGIFGGSGLFDKKPLEIDSEKIAAAVKKGMDDSTNKSQELASLITNGMMGALNSSLI